jgi:hypothetical protein
MLCGAWTRALVCALTSPQNAIQFAKAIRYRLHEFRLPSQQARAWVRPSFPSLRSEDTVHKPVLRIKEIRSNPTKAGFLCQRRYVL